MTKRTNKRGILHTYKSYMFRDKDPIIDCLRTARSDANLTIKRASEGSGVSTTTLYNWEKGKTRRTFFDTSMAIARVCGATGVAFNSHGQPRLLFQHRSTAIYKLPKTKEKVS